MAKFQLGAEIKFKGMFLSNPSMALRVFEKEFGKALDTSLALFYRLVVRGTPVHGGGYKNSIFREKRGRGLALHGIVGTPLPQGGFIETGKPAHFPNVDNLRDWVRLKLGVSGQQLDKLTFVIGRSLARGTSKFQKANGYRMFQKAFNQGRMRVQGIMDKAARRITEIWGK